MFFRHQTFFSATAAAALIGAHNINGYPHSSNTIGKDGEHFDGGAGGPIGDPPVNGGHDVISGEGGNDTRVVGDKPNELGDPGTPIGVGEDRMLTDDGKGRLVRDDIPVGTFMGDSRTEPAAPIST